MNFLQKMVLRAGSMVGLTSEQFATQLFGQNSTTRRYGDGELLKGFSTMPWLRAVSGRVSTACAAVPWKLYATKSKETGKFIRHRGLAQEKNPHRRMQIYKDLRDNDLLVEIEEHPLLNLIDWGNPLFPGTVVRELTTQYLDLTGECAWILEKNGAGLPCAIYPVPNIWIVDYPRGDRRYFIITLPQQGSINVPEEDIVFFRHPDPWDPYQRATSLGRVLADELETDEYAAKTLKQWFRNKGRPDLLITMEGATTPERDRLQDDWMKKLMGVWNVNKPYFSNRKVDVKELSQSFVDMQMSQLRKDERDIIIHVFGFPPEIFGILENANRSTIDAADYLFAKYGQVPRLEFQRTMMTRKLVPMYDDRLIFDYVSPVMEDAEFELKVMTAKPAAFTVDEWRAKGGRPEKKDGTGGGTLAEFNQIYVQSLAELSGEPAPPVDEEDEEEDTPDAADGK